MSKLLERIKSWRKSLDKDSPIYKISNCFVRPYSYLSYKIQMVQQFIDAFHRMLGRKDPRYQKLYGLKNAYKGKRCFIACTGPSLTIADLEKLKGEYVFGMNSLCLIQDQTDWRPDFFVIQDNNVFSKIKDTIISNNYRMCFVPIAYKTDFNTPDDWIYFHVSSAYHLYEIWETKEQKYFTWFSNNAYATVYDGYSVTYAIFQLAMYMGFKEIYLIGCDCNYFGEKQHFIEHGHIEYNPETIMDRMGCAFSKAKKAAEKKGVVIINSTRGGKLEIYPRKSIEEVLSNDINNKNH